MSGKTTPEHHPQICACTAAPEVIRYIEIPVHLPVWDIQVIGLYGIFRSLAELTLQVIPVLRRYTVSASAWWAPAPPVRRAGHRRATRPYFEHCDPERSEMEPVLRFCDDTVAPCPDPPPPPPRRTRWNTPAAPAPPPCPRHISAWEDPRFGWVLAGAVEYLQNLLDTYPDPDGRPAGTAARDLMECAGKASRFPRLVGTRGDVFSDVHPWSLDCPASGPFDADSDCAFASRISLTGMMASRNNKWPPVRPSATCTHTVLPCRRPREERYRAMDEPRLSAHYPWCFRCGLWWLPCFSSCTLSAWVALLLGLSELAVPAEISIDAASLW